MPFVAAPGIARLDAVWMLETELVENTFHYHRGSAWDVATLEGICNTYFAWATASVGIFSDAAGLVKCFARDLSSAGGAEVDMFPPVGISGTDSSGKLPNNVTWALKRQTGLAGRKNRGRIYMIGLPLSNVTADKNHINAAHAANLASVYEGLLTAQLSDNAATETILHRVDGTGTPVIGYTWSDLTLDSQRRRLPNHNRHH